MEINEKEKRVQRFLIENKKYLPQNSILTIKEQLLKLTEEQLETVS